MNQNIYVESEYFEQNPTWHVEDSAWKAQQIIKMIIKNSLEPKSVCEVGCGAGEILNQLSLQMSKDTMFTGYEISPHAFKLCQDRKKDRLEFYLKNIFEDNQSFFDVCLAIDVFEHVEDYLNFVRNLRKKAQYKIFHIPLDLSVQTVLLSSPILRARQKVGHIHYFTKETALLTLQDTGYEILDYFYTSSSNDLSTKSLKRLAVKFPRMLMYALHQDLAVRILGGYSLLVLAK